MRFTGAISHPWPPRGDGGGSTVIRACGIDFFPTPDSGAGTPASVSPASSAWTKRLAAFTRRGTPAMG